MATAEAARVALYGHSWRRSAIGRVAYAPPGPRTRGPIPATPPTSRVPLAVDGPVHTFPIAYVSSLSLVLRSPSLIFVPYR